jgi:hypothetical protein
MVIPSKLSCLLALTVVTLGIHVRSSRAEMITVANASFELPELTDGNFVSSPSLANQGGYGWTTGEGLYNPPSNTYLNAAGSGTPMGADGIQVGFVNGAVGALEQELFGVDGIGGNSDDPLLAPRTMYILTVAVGRRLQGNQYGVDAFGGYELRMLAGSTLIGLEFDDAIQEEGVFVDRTLIVDSSTLDPALLGQPLTIQLLIAQSSSGVTDFDNVRLEAISLSSIAPDSVTVTRGLYIGGDVASLTGSDNSDYQLQRLGTDISSRTEFEVKGTSPTATPAIFEFDLEGAVFARSNVVQTIELFDYDAAAWELVHTSDAARSPAPDSVATGVGTGDLSRFVEAGTLCIKVRIHFQSDNARQRFASNTDRAVWTIQ